MALSWQQKQRKNLRCFLQFFKRKSRIFKMQQKLERHTNLQFLSHPGFSPVPGAEAVLFGRGLRCVCLTGPGGKSLKIKIVGVKSECHYKQAEFRKKTYFKAARCSREKDVFLLTSS
ncbi:V-set and immunoglobulin domain-containing protein 2 [Platysternon megacephalum]|nr:V-set and immunoglobulin domain-containing protein 2 [Platysternon megacephalum]